MAETDQAESAWVRVPRTELEGLVEALRHYLHAFGSDSDVYGQAGIRAFRRDTKHHDGYLWEHLWYGRNHQHIKVGDTVRRQSADDDPEFVEATVLAVSTFAVLLDDELSGVAWEVWPLVHRLDRLHTQPEFDCSHWVPIQRHMGYDVQAEDAVAYTAHCAERGMRQSHLSVVKDAEGGDLP